MGVHGLWEVLKPAGQPIALTKLAVVDGFENNLSGKRAYRIGIDASLWYQHAQRTPDKGANPQIRTLFYRLVRLAELPWLVLFVFDGFERPKIKRNSRMGKSGSHNMTKKFKEMIESFGMEWRTARGEAEAELAYLNAQGIIDAVVTDDVDTFVFGARTVMPNWSLTLTGNKARPARNTEGETSKHHTILYTSDRISSHPEIGLTRGGMVLFAMLAGGDYDTAGARGIGPETAHGLARCGFGDTLLAAYQRGEAHFRAFLPQWRTEINTELRSNASGHLRSRRPGSMLQSDWPDMAILDAYVNPICSATNGRGAADLALRDRTDMSLPRIAQFCEDHFDEWAHRSRLLERLNNMVWEGAVCHVLRRAALEADAKEKTKRIREGRSSSIQGPLRPSPADGVGTPASLVQRCLDPAKKDLRMERYAAAFVRRAPQAASASTANIHDTDPLIASIVGTKEPDASTDYTPLYRVEINCKQLRDLADKGIRGKHPEPPPKPAMHPLNLPDEDGVYGTAGPKKKPPNPTEKDTSTKRLLIAASIMRQVHPAMVEEFETHGPPKKPKGGRNKAPKATAKKGRKKSAVEEQEEDDGEEQGSDEDEDFVVDQPGSSVRSQPTQRAQSSASAPPVRASIPARASLLRETASASTAMLPRAPETSAPPPRRTMYNVGEIDFEIRWKSRFIFTFTDPCDPDMLVVEDDSASAVPEEFIAGSSAGPSRYVVRSAASGLVDLDEGNDEGFEAAPDAPGPLQLTAEQEAIIDRRLGLAGPSMSAKAKGKKPARASTARKASTARRAPQKDPTPETGELSSKAKGKKPTKKRAIADDGERRGAVDFEADFDERVPAIFTPEQEAMIDARLGIIGGPTQKKAKVGTSRKRSAVGESGADAGAKRRKTGAAAAPVVPQTFAPASQPPAGPVDTSYPRPAAQKFSFDDDIIELSSSEETPSHVSSSKRAPMAGRTNAWDMMMPSSSQDSRLDDLEFDWDLA